MLRDVARARGVGFCNIDQPVIGRSMKPTERTTSPIGYVRLHGRRYDTWFMGRSSNHHPRNATTISIQGRGTRAVGAARVKHVSEHSRSTYVYHEQSLSRKRRGERAAAHQHIERETTEGSGTAARALSCAGKNCGRTKTSRERYFTNHKIPLEINVYKLTDAGSLFLEQFVECFGERQVGARSRRRLTSRCAALLWRDRYRRGVFFHRRRDTRKKRNRCAHLSSRCVPESAAYTQTARRYQNARTACSSAARSRISDTWRSGSNPTLITVPQLEHRARIAESTIRGVRERIPLGTRAARRIGALPLRGLFGIVLVAVLLILAGQSVLR